MGSTQDQAWTDRIVSDLIKRHDIRMIHDRRNETTRVYLDFAKRKDLKIKDVVMAKDLWEDGNVRNLIVKKVTKLKSSTLGMIASSDNGHCTLGNWRTRIGEVETLDNFGAASGFGGSLLFRIACLVIAARMYDLLVRNIELIEDHVDMSDFAGDY